MSRLSIIISATLTLVIVAAVFGAMLDVSMVEIGPLEVRTTGTAIQFCPSEDRTQGYSIEYQEWNRLGLYWFWEEDFGGERFWKLEISIWWLVFLAALPPLFSSARALRSRRKRIKQGKCAACGYDLQGTVGDCPECGAERPT